jgi:hypothetical protein
MQEPVKVFRGELLVRLREAPFELGPPVAIFGFTLRLGKGTLQAAQMLRRHDRGESFFTRQQRRS